MTLVKLKKSMEGWFIRYGEGQDIHYHFRIGHARLEMKKKRWKGS